MPIRDKVYNKLKSLGLTDSKEDFFNYYDSDESVRKDVYQRLKEDGLRNTEDEFYAVMNPQKDIQKSEDDAVFEANAERFRSGQPIERVTTQSVIDANPELGLQTNAVQPENPKWNVPQYDWRTNQQKKIDELSNSTTATPVQDQYGNEYYPVKPREVAYDEAVKGLKDISERKAETKSRLQTISNDVNNELNRLQSRVKVSDLDKFRPANLQSMPVNPVNQELMPEYTALRKAQRLVEESNNIIEEASKKGNTNFMAGLARGFWDNLNAEDYTFGADDAAQSAFLYRALDKAEKGESLTKAEETLLDAASINMAVQSYYAQDLGKGYGAGQVTAESIPFMLEMAINPISASGKTTAKALLNYGLKKFAKNKAAKVGARLAGDALAATGMAATTGFGDVLEGATDRLAQNYNYQLDDEGRLHVEKKDDTMGMGEAFARSFATRAIENQSEMIFKAFEPIGGFMKGVQDVLPGGVNKFFEMLGNNKVADAYRYIKNSPVFRNYLVKDIRNATQIGGLGEEYLEEVYNNIANAAIGEMKWEDVVSLDKNIDTLLGLAPTQVMFGLLGLGGAGAMRYQTRKTLEDLQATMNEQQRKDLEGLLDMGLDAKEVDVRGFIRNVMQNESYTIENKRDLIKAAYNVAKQNGIDELTEADTIDKVNAENALIDSVTDPSTGIYTEITATLPDAKEGTIEVPGYIVGWLGEGEKRQPIFVQEGMENTYENRRVLKPGQWSEEAVQQMPAEEVKAVSEEMIREEAANQSEQEAKYAPEVINAQMQQGVPFDTPNAQIVPVAPMSEGNGWIVEEYALDTNNKVAKTPIVRELTNDEYRDMLQAQLNAEEAAQEQISAEEQAASPEVVEEVQPTEEADIKENLTTESGNNLSPVEEVAQPQTPVIPTKEDGSIDFVSYGKEGTFKTLGEKYGEKMPNKVSVTAKALAEDLKKAQNKLQKAEEAYDNAPIGREQKAEEARDKAKQELEAIQREANFWAEMDAEIKDAQARRESMLNPQAEVETSTEPMNVDEFVAQQLASGNIVLDKEDYKKETGYGDTEANAMNGGATKLFGKNGMTIQEAGERLMEIDRENGTNFFDQLDSNSGRDALINVLGSVKTRKELNQYIATNRAEQAKRESEGLRNELEKQAMEANYASLEDYVLQMEVEEMENPFLNDRADEIMAIFAEEAAKYEQSLNNTENGQGTENEVVEENDSILLEEQLDNTGGTEVSEESERIGDGTSEESESAHAATEVELKQEEGETTLQFAERAAEENRRRPLRKRAEEWSKALGIKVTYLESIDDVDAKTRAQIEAAHAKGESVPGWVNKKGEVFFFMPDLSDLKDVDDTYIHEVVAHVGLPQLLGKERFGELCDKVWDMMPQSEKDYYYNYPGVNSTDDSTKEGKIERQRRAADEYIAHIAEQQNFTPEEKTIWDNIVKMFREMLDKALNGIISKSKLTDEDISNLIKASYANLKSGAEGSVSGEGTKFRAKWRKGQLDKASRTIRRWLENNTRGKSFEIELPKATLDKVRKAMGRDFESHNITSNGIVHALKNHGENGLKLTGISIPLSKEDVELIPYIMTSPDRVEKASTDASGRESVRFYKDLSNGYVVVVEKEYKNSPDDMETITMWAELSSKATNAQQNAAPDTHVRNAILSIDIAKIRKDAEDAIEEDENLKEKTSFRVVKDKNGNKSLVGLHNISEDKLKKAIKQGGLANPSMAVIDMDKQSHVDYGDITLVAPESLVDKKLGKNIGTYMADAYTPVYPTVVKKLSDKGGKALTKALEPVDETFRSKVRTYFNSYLETGTHYDALAYWYLSDTGKNPPILEAALPEGFTKEEVEKVKSINSEADSFFQLSEDEKQKALYLYADKFFGGIKEYENHLADYTKRMQEVVQDESKPQFVRKNIQQNLNAIERYGYEYDRVAGYYNRAVFLASRQSKPSEFETFRNAFDEVSKNGLEEDFGNWMTAKEAELGVEEKLFAGYDNQGRAKYLPNTLENASKLMKKEGRAGATGLGGFNYFVAILAPVAKTTKEINKKKGNLSTQEEYDAFAKKWSEYYHDLALQLQPGADKWADYGYHRLHEIAPMSNPKDYVKREYGIELSDKFIKDLNEVKTAIKNDFPARYFETKFERPVYLNEFAAAVVPKGTSKDVVDALTEVGLPIEEYESGNNEARMAAVDKVSSEIEGIRFRFIGERGARNLDKAEEATTRLDNLAVAREMEAAEKDAKTIKMATGWERGADGLWRYETMDSETAIKDGDEVEIRKQIEDIEEEEKAYKKKAREEGIGPDEREEAYINFYRRRGFLEAQLAYVMAKNADVLTHISTSLHHVLDKTDSDSLFKAYPELEFVKVGFATELVGKSLGATVINGSRIEAINLDVKRSTPEELNGYLAHEIQHAIQEIEGFAPGGEPSMESPRKAEQKAKNISFMKDKLDKSVSERNSLLKQRNEINDKMSAWWDAHEDATREDMLADEEMQQYNREYDELSKQIDEADNTVKFNEKWLDATLQANTALGYEGYKKLAGEVEARNVTSRLGMTLEQRRSSLASETEDVAREDQIFLKDGFESGLRFRLSEKGKQIQAEVDKFTSKYNSKPVRIVEAEMDDNELMKTLDYAFELEDVKSFMKESKTAAGYFHNLDKIIIFADKTKVERMEEYLFHENIHAAIHHNNFANLVAHFYEYAKNEAVFEKWSKLAHNKEYKQYNTSEEFLAYVVSNAMVARNLDEVAEYLGDKQKKALNKLFNVIGYDYDIRRRSDEQSVNGRTSEETSGESSLEGNELLNTGEGRGSGNGTGKGKSGKVSAAERKARLNELFNKVADMGLQGVLGNKEYTSLMVDIYKALPEDVRAEIAEDALRLYGGSVAPAVSDYIGPKSKNSIMDKVVTIVREALRKIGFDLDLNANEVRYMAWRSKKPLDRNNMFEVAEDIDMKYSLKVGEYDGSPAENEDIYEGDDNVGVKFRVVTDASLIEELDSSEKRIGYRNVVLNEDGSFGSPMADKLGKTGGGKKKTSGFEIGKWEQAEENPDLVDENGKIDLIKPDGKQIKKVDYNPYIHNRLNCVNRQFKQAWERPDLVYVETEIPMVDLESGYHADKAKKPVGEHKWNGGNLILSRYDKPIRIVGWEEVADDWEKEFKKKGVHFDIVPPALLPILADRGVKILPPHKGMGEECNKAYQKFVGTTPDGGGTRFKVVYHGTGVDFDKFDHSFMSSGEGNQSFGWGTYVTDVEDVARIYARNHPNASGLAKAGLESERNRLKEAIPFRRGEVLEESKRKLEEIENKLANMKDTGKHLYYVDIPDNDGTNYISWDETLPKEQAERIKDAVRKSDFFKAYEKEYGKLAEERLDAWTKTTGGRAYKYLENFTLLDKGADKVISKLLSEAGFVGIEYPTNYMSGGNENGTKNYVIFNEKDLDIKEHTRFRVSNKLQVRDKYESTIKKGGYQAREAVQDAMLSLRKFQELIEKATGKKVRDFENAWMHENRLSSVVQAEIHDMERKFYKPMMDAVKKLMKVANLEQEQVADYLMLKHGIERNREMAVRKALTDDKGKIDRTRLEQWYQEKDAIRNDATLDTWRKKQEAMDNAALNYGADMSRDYSGLTSMFGIDDLADSTQKAYDEVEALENAHPVETESLGKAIKAMTQNTLDKSFESGLMDRKVYDELSKDMYDYYIPLRGFEETTSEEVYAYLDQDRGAFNAPLKRAKGRSSKSDNPIAYLKSIAESGIMQGNRNKMKQSFLNMVINHPSDLVSVREGVWVIYNPATGEWEAASAPAIPNNATPADVEAAMEAWEQQMEQAAQNDPNIKKISEAADVPYRVVGNRMDQHQVIVKRLGKSYTLTINGNPRLAMAINGQTNPNNTSNDGKVAAFVNNKIGSINRSLAAWYTTRNPDFVASNFMRDTFYTNTIVRAKEGNAYANKFHKNYAMVLPKMLGLFHKYENGTLNPADQTDAAFLDFMMNGGETGYSNLKDLEEIKKQISKELKGNRFAKVEALAEKLDILNRAVENTARFAAFLTSREEGRSIAKSIFDAKEISVNFNKKGAGGTFFGMTGQTWFGNLAAMIGASGRALYVFFNAAIQGSTNLMHVMKVNPKGTSAGLAAMFLMGAVVPFLFDDDDDEKDYYDLPEHVRRNHLIIPGAGDAWISIPLPIEYRIMYGMGELLTSWRTGHERGSDIARKMLGMSGQALPLNFLEEGLEAFVPSAISPIYQVMTNSSWTGLPIYKENDFNKDDPEYTKAYSNVDRNLLKFTKALYEWSFDEENQKERIDLNPAIIETLAKGYFGGLATQLSNIAKVGGMIAGEQEFDWRNIPIGNRILKTGDERTKEKRVTNEYFENMEKLDFLQSRERMLKKTEKGVAVQEVDKFKAQKDLETMQGTEVYKKYQEFKKQKKVVDKIRKTIKEKGSTPEREKQLMEAQEKANKSVR